MSNSFTHGVNTVIMQMMGSPLLPYLLKGMVIPNTPPFVDGHEQTAIVLMATVAICRAWKPPNQRHSAAASAKGEKV